MFRVTILGDIWETLRDRCKKSSPLEDGGFILARPVETTSGVRLVVDREVSLPNKGERWNIQEEFRLRPTTDYKSIAMGESYQTDRIPLFVHNHPSGPAGFSSTDEEMHAAWLRDFVESSSQGAFGSLVIHGQNVTGALWTGTDYKNDRHSIDVVNCCGNRPIRSVRHPEDVVSRNLRNKATIDEADNTLTEAPSSEFKQSSDLDMTAVADRQMQLIKRLGQERLSSARVAIVGLGGTGSATAIQCARSGIGSLLLIDPDSAEVSNANRLYGMTLEQAEEGTPKTAVLENHLNKTTLAEIETVQDDVMSGDYDSALLDCDLIFGCTDRHAPRAYLNKLAVLYGIPYIDVGTRPTASNGKVLNLLGETRHVVNGGPCLWCLDVLDAWEIRREHMPDDLVEQEIEDGYLRDGGPEPSIIPMTTLAATMGVTQAVAYLLNQENVWDEKVIFYLWSCEVQWEPNDRKEDCICQQEKWKPRNENLSTISY